jgi:hypothetical protein
MVMVVTATSKRSKTHARASDSSLPGTGDLVMAFTGFFKDLL